MSFFDLLLLIKIREYQYYIVWPQRSSMMYSNRFRTHDLPHSGKTRQPLLHRCRYMQCMLLIRFLVYFKSSPMYLYLIVYFTYVEKKKRIFTFWSIADMYPMLNEGVHRRWIDKAIMNKRKWTRLQRTRDNDIHKPLHRKLKIGIHKRHLIPGWTILISFFSPDWYGWDTSEYCTRTI